MGGIPIPVSTLSYPPGRMHWYRYGCEPSHCSVCGVTRYPDSAALPPANLAALQQVMGPLHVF